MAAATLLVAWACSNTSTSPPAGGDETDVASPAPEDAVAGQGSGDVSAAVDIGSEAELTPSDTGEDLAADTGAEPAPDSGAVAVDADEPDVAEGDASAEGDAVAVEDSIDMGGATGKVPYPECTQGPFPPTIDPALVPQDAKAAYALALEIPEVLNCCVCYCGCMDFADHKTLLYCYTDDHAVG